jgi:CHAD domain-containing protein
MNQQEAIAAVENRFKKINSCLNLLKENFAIEEIHEFRVGVKKLKALLLRLEKGLSHDAEFKFTRRFKKIYRILGKIRNLQLQQKRIADMVTETGAPRPFTYEQLLDSACREKIKKAKKIINGRKFFREDEKNIFTHLKEDYTNTNGWIPLRPKTASLLKLCSSKKPDKAELHGFRKSLKNYLYSLAGKGSLHNNGRSTSIAYKSIAKLLGDWLGEYRDISTGLDFLQLTHIKNLPAEEQILLRDIKKKWFLERENIMQKIYSTLKDNQEISNQNPG